MCHNVEELTASRVSDEKIIMGLQIWKGGKIFIHRRHNYQWRNPKNLKTKLTTLKYD